MSAVKGTPSRSIRGSFGKRQRESVKHVWSVQWAMLKISGRKLPNQKFFFLVWIDCQRWQWLLRFGFAPQPLFNTSSADVITASCVNYRLFVSSSTHNSIYTLRWCDFLLIKYICFCSCMAHFLIGLRQGGLLNFQTLKSYLPYPVVYEHKTSVTSFEWKCPVWAVAIDLHVAGWW